MSFTANPRRGYILGLAAYCTWGMFPLYFKSLEGIPAIEVVVHRVLWSALFGALLLMIWRHPGWFRELLAHPKRLLALTASGALIAVNWLTYVWAVHNDYMVEASLGYYINPLINVLIGTLFLGETLSRAQWAAVALAAVGVAILAAGALTTLWISVVLAISFAVYGVVRRTLPVGSLPGLTVEALVLTPPALGAILFIASGPAGVALGQDGPVDFAVSLSGLITAIPLLMFAIAARRMDYSTLGFVQFIAPTTVFILGLTVFHEPLHPAQLWSFIFIWIAIAVFAWDLLKRHRQLKAATSV